MSDATADGHGDRPVSMFTGPVHLRLGAKKPPAPERDHGSGGAQPGEPTRHVESLQTAGEPLHCLRVRAGLQVRSPKLAAVLRRDLVGVVHVTGLVQVPLRPRRSRHSQRGPASEGTDASDPGAKAPDAFEVLTTRTASAMCSWRILVVVCVWPPILGRPSTHPAPLNARTPADPVHLRLGCSLAVCWRRGRAAGWPAAAVCGRSCRGNADRMVQGLVPSPAPRGRKGLSRKDPWIVNSA